MGPLGREVLARVATVPTGTLREPKQQLNLGGGVTHGPGAACREPRNGAMVPVGRGVPQPGLPLNLHTLTTPFLAHSVPRSVLMDTNVDQTRWAVW